MPAVEDNREMCFEQGKACVYEAEDDPETIVTEWPNGVTERSCTRTGTKTRTWPDGLVETAAEDADWEVPKWPRVGTSSTEQCPS